MAITKAPDKINKSTQEMGNLSFDTEFNLNTVENLVYNPTTCEVDRMTQPATETKQDDTNTKIDTLITAINNLLTELQKKTEPADSQLSDLTDALRNLFIVIANPSYVDKSANQIRSQITGSLTTVTNLTNLTNFGTYPADYLNKLQSMAAWSVTNRNLIT